MTGKNAGADDCPDAKALSATTGRGSSGACARVLPIPDQLIDRLAGKQLAGQRSSPQSVRWGCQCCVHTAGSGPVFAGRNLFQSWEGDLALGDAACCLLELLLVFAARSRCASPWGARLFAGGALQLLAFQFVFNLVVLCHGITSFRSNLFRGFPHIGPDDRPAVLQGVKSIVNRELIGAECRGLTAAVNWFRARYSGANYRISKVQWKVDQKLTPPARSGRRIASDEPRTTRTNHRVDRSSLCVLTRYTAHLRRE